ncbi:ATP-binding protein [Lewinella sp. W8]|uniref:ATP-binding protein n=1 Tax=Lewinella sp. W8 TaxID=2528208 RepID=UPI00106720B2|nr:ATP-binding protein [Lewinella sp. W8]MTB51201.1 hypothetical protein [Lewinella sp. W8]
MSAPSRPSSAKIDTLYVKLHNYAPKKLDGESGERYNNWVGRVRLERYLKRLIKEECSGNSAYLITGYRGIGKTSLLRKSIHEANNPSPKKRNNKRAQSSLRWILPILAILIVGGLYSLAFFMEWIPRDWIPAVPNGDSLDSWTLLEVIKTVLIIILVIYLLILPIFLAWDAGIFLSEKANSSEQYRSFEIPLSQEDVTEKDVYSQIAQQLLRWFNEVTPTSILYRRPLYLPIRGIANIFTPRDQALRQKQYHQIGARLLHLNDRLYGEVSRKNELSLEPSVRKQFGLSAVAVSSSLFRYSSNDQISYPLASAKEIEAELMFLLNDLDRLRRNRVKYLSSYPFIPKFVFILDELDKMEPSGNLAEFEEDQRIGAISINNSRLRERQDTVGRLLGNLKSFLNSAPATFFFIGGRELFDASLADIADRDSFYSSIFSDVIYVNSFFKEKVYPYSSNVSDATENFLCKLLVDGYDLEEEYKLDNIFPRRDDPVFQLLKTYVVYLTYRSNGTPKKLISLIEDLIVKGDNLGPRVQHYYDAKTNKRIYTKNDAPTPNHWFLKFSAQKQFEVFLTAELYHPYLVTNSSHVKSYGDKLLFSSAFIMDHLLKFHSFGFSWRNLETIPEVILGNADPHLRSFLEQLISHLSYNYIRPTISGLFQYKFYSEISQEISLLAKISEQSAAAFTFTLDESRQVKRHYKLKLRELENKYSDFTPVKGMNQFVHSIAFIQTILGDLHFYDQEFEDAVIYYTDSIQTLRFPTNRRYAITSHQVFIWTRNMLKLSLSLEKMKAFDSAYSTYQTIINDVPLYAKWLIGDDLGNSEGATNTDPFESYRNLQLLNIPFLAKLALIEKYRYGGISQHDLKEARVGLFNLLLSGNEKSQREEEENRIAAYRKRVHKSRGQLNRSLLHEEFVEHKIHHLKLSRHQFLFADYYHNLGTLLFFKNNSAEGEDLSKWGYIMRLYYPEVAEYLDDLTPIVKREEIEKGTKEEEYKDPAKRTFSIDYRPSIIAYYNYKKALWLLLKNKLEDKLIRDRIKFLLVDRIEVRHRDYLLKKVADIKKEFEDPANERSLIGAYTASGFFPGASPAKAFQQEYAGYDAHPEKSQAQIDHAKKIVTWFLEQFPTYDLFSQTFMLLHDDFRGNWNASMLFYSANLWSKLGDATIATMNMAVKWEDPETAKVYKNALELLFKSLQDSVKPDSGRSSGQQGSLSFRQQWAQRLFVQPVEDSLNFPESAISLYYVSHLYYQYAIKPYSSAFQLYKILWVIYFSLGPSGTKFSKATEEEQAAYRKTVKMVCEAMINTIGRMLDRVEGDETLSENFDAPPANRAKSSNIYLAAKIMGRRILRILDYPYELNQDDLGKLENSPFVRLHLIRELSIDLLKGCRNKKSTIEDVKHGLYYCHEVIATLNKYGSSYNILQSQLGEAHYQMAQWCEKYHNLGQDACQQEVQNHFGREFPADPGLSPIHHYRKAIEHFYFAIHTHTENHHYQSLIGEMYFLEDDFNDNLFHFSAALERVYLNNGMLRNYIKVCKLKIESLNRSAKVSG